MHETKGPTVAHRIDLRPCCRHRTFPQWCLDRLRFRGGGLIGVSCSNGWKTSLRVWCTLRAWCLCFNLKQHQYACSWAIEAEAWLLACYRAV
ncbi:hypothetical protein VFPPC_16273 [Pochonia chlamydosporia 170]|uniref:Uncharacterized protein n=1 Tax=Pochonia chlamydosporia 170 TaxID=1380566 RepID=A0A179FHK9_METCM|nr:hypothetical protein VFPPC_16273 [Pochonia chlamydosporia 170]OAQ64897.1 hypothetical protein VFPPC_16273 [Pochonia chlamydosporia 170]